MQGETSFLHRVTGHGRRRPVEKPTVAGGTLHTALLADGKRSPLAECGKVRQPHYLRAHHTRRHQRVPPLSLSLASLRSPCTPSNLMRPLHEWRSSHAHVSRLRDFETDEYDSHNCGSLTSPSGSHRARKGKGWRRQGIYQYPLAPSLTSASGPFRERPRVRQAGACPLHCWPTRLQKNDDDNNGCGHVGCGRDRPRTCVHVACAR